MNKILEWLEQIKEFINEYAYKMIIGLATFCVILLFVLGFKIIKESSPSVDKSSESSTTQQSNDVDTNTNSSEDVYVDIKGEVKHPGMYKMNATSRVNDVISKADGFSKKADQSTINLAQSLSDQEVIVVDNYKNHNKNAQSTFQNQGTGNSNVSGTDSGKVHLNTADATELQKLDRVGAKTAQKIIDYRNENHGFKNVEEIKQVSGLGDKSYERLKNSVAL